MPTTAKLNVPVEFDVETGELRLAQGEIDKMKDSTNKSAGAFSSMGKIVGGLGIAAFFADTARRVSQSSESVHQMTVAWGETIGLLTAELEPVLQLVTRGFSGLMQVLVSLVRVISTGVKDSVQVLADIMAGNWADAWTNSKKLVNDSVDEMLLGLARGAERAQGITAAAEKEQSKIIIEEGKIRLKDLTLSGEQKLRMIDEIEANALNTLRRSAEYQQAVQIQRLRMEQEIQRDIATEREAAGREELAQAEDRAKVRTAFLQAQMQNESLTLEQRLKALDEVNAAEEAAVIAQNAKLFRNEEASQQALETVRMNARIRRANLEKAAADEELETIKAGNEAQLLEIELAKLEQQDIRDEGRRTRLQQMREEFSQAEAALRAHGEALGKSEEDISADILRLRVGLLRSTRQLRQQELQEQNQTLANRVALVRQWSAPLLQEASKGEGTIRDLLRRSAAETIRIAGREASTRILVRGAAMAWDAASKTGWPAGLIVGAGILAAAGAAAAGVAAAAGAAANAITAPMPAATTPPAAETPALAGGGWEATTPPFGGAPLEAGGGPPSPAGANVVINRSLVVNTWGRVPAEHIRDLDAQISEEDSL